MAKRTKRARFSRAAVVALYPHYFAVRSVAKAMGLLRSYADGEGIARAARRDVTLHDRRILQATPIGVPFAWYVYPHGSHLRRGDASYQWGLKGRCTGLPVHVARDISSMFDGGRWYVWDGRALIACDTPEDASYLLSLSDLADRHAEQMAAIARAS